MNKIKSEQSGRSMVEMLGVLAIIGVLSVGGIAGYSKAMAKFKLSKAMDQVSTIVTNLRTLYSSQPNYKGLTTSVAIKAGAIPTEMLNGVSPTSATAIYNAYGGKVLISADNTSLRNQRSFSIALGGLGKEACVALSTADWGNESGSGFVGVIGFKASLERETDILIMASSIDKSATSLSAAAINCTGVGDTNAVMWEFY